MTLHVNDPHCDFVECRNAASGQWEVGGQRVYTCDTHREDMEDQGIPVRPWWPLIPDPVQARIDRRLAELRDSVFAGGRP